MFRKVILKPFSFGIEPGAKLKGGMGGDSTPLPNSRFRMAQGKFAGQKCRILKHLTVRSFLLK